MLPQSHQVGDKETPVNVPMNKTAKAQACLPAIVQELCESRGGRPGLSVLTILLVSVDVKNY